MFPTNGGSWRLLRIAGIDISAHWSLLLFLALFLLSSGPAATLLISILFGCVLLHELGHALAARFFGIPTLGILLTPIGGVAFLLGWLALAWGVWRGN